MTLETIGEREMDRLCWLLVSTRNRFYPPDETAEECIDVQAENGNEPTTHACGHEHGYHSGMFISRNMFMEQLYGYGIDVLARANRYTYANREHGMEFRLDEEPDFYQHIKDGPEEDAATGELFEDVNIEEIEVEDPPYVPRGAENE